MKSCGCTGSLPCGCCAGTEAVTPLSEYNRPGLDALVYRAGTHPTFLETMEVDLARDARLNGLSTRDTSDTSIALLDAWATTGDVLTFYQERIANEGYLATATERRSVMELGNLIGYEPRPGVSASVFLAYNLETGQTGTIPAGSLVRSTPNPGETQQAFETSEDLDADSEWNNLQVRLTQPSTRTSILKERAVYLQGLVSSVKKDDPLFVQFAGQDVLLCRVLSVDQDTAAGRTRIGLEEWGQPGVFPVDDDAVIADQLRDFLRIEDFGLSRSNFTVKSVVQILTTLVQSLDAGSRSGLEAGLARIAALGDAARSTKVQDWAESIASIDIKSGGNTRPPLIATVDYIASSAGLLTEPSLAPPSQYNRPSALQTLFQAPAQASTNASKRASTVTELPQISGSALATLSAFRPAFRASLATALANAFVTPNPVIAVYSVVRTAPFGYNAGPQPTTSNTPGKAAGQTAGFTTSWGEWDLDTEDKTEAVPVTPKLDKIDLEKEFDKVSASTLVAIQQGAAIYSLPKSAPVVSTVARADYGLSSKVTRLKFPDPVLTYNPSDTPPDPNNLGFLRRVKVFLSDTLLPLAEQPIPDPVCGSDTELELDSLYEGLTPGKWIILDGERADTSGTSGVHATELLLIGNVQHRASDGLPGDRIHTFLQTVVPSSYCYKRATLKIWGNVVKATNGETRKEVLGSGDASIPFQSFTLKQPPVTFLSAPTASGSASTLKVYVNDVEWHEVDSPVGLGPYDRNFFTSTADDGTTKVIFGDGVRGMRVPTGVANVKAAYRTGLGKGGNVQAGELNILGSKTAGVKDVINPLAAAGGADKDPRDRIRENAPLTVTALDRLVSVADYSYFSQTFAGIGKSSSVALTDGQRRLVHVTIAGIDDIPITPSSDLYLNLLSALHLFGDPNQALQLDVRTAKFLVLEAGVKLDPDYQWEVVAPQVTAALLDAFSFERRKLGQSAYLSEALRAMQQVPGVVYVDPALFGAIDEGQLTPSGIVQAISTLTLAQTVTANLATSGPDGIIPAEIAYFTPDVPATIALNQL
jgi:predicted phage baseplate assembly protein